jgi:hypothetical protein
MRWNWFVIFFYILFFLNNLLFLNYLIHNSFYFPPRNVKFGFDNLIFLFKFVEQIFICLILIELINYLITNYFLIYSEINTCVITLVFTKYFSTSESDKINLNKEIETFNTKIGTKIIPIKIYKNAEICKQNIFDDNRKKAGIYL